MKKQILFLITLLITCCVGCGEVDSSISENHSSEENSVALETTPQATFVSDWVEGEKNNIGNAPWNLGGYVAEQGEWTYYFVDDALCKEDKNGNRYTIVSPLKGRNLNIIGDWIYFGNSQGLCKIRTDGNEFSNMPNAGTNFFVTEDVILYTTRNQVSANYFQYSINICNTDFTNNKEIHKFDQISDGHGMGIKFLGMYEDKVYLSVYYVKYGNYGTNNYSAVGICAVNIKDSTFEIISDNNQFVFANGVIVENKLISTGETYGNSRHPSDDPLSQREVYALDLDSLESEVLVEDFPLKIYSIGYHPYKVLVLGTDGGIWSDSVENLQSGVGVQASMDPSRVVAITEDYIYYKSYGSTASMNKLYRVDLFGQNWKEMGSVE